MGLVRMVLAGTVKTLAGQQFLRMVYLETVGLGLLREQALNTRGLQPVVVQPVVGCKCPV